MAIKWDPSLEMGVEEIDNQHKELFERVDRLLEAGRKGQGKDEVGKLVKFLGDYVKVHFNSEEKKMVEAQYPGYDGHKIQHLEFTRTFEELEKDFYQNGPTLSFVLNVNRIVVDWLINHIRKSDKAIGKFLTEAK